MNLIEHLNRTVTPAILTDNATSDIKELLTQFYAIFCTRLADESAYQKLENSGITLDNKLYQKMWEDNTQAESLISELANSNHLDHQEVNLLITTCTPLVYQEVDALAGDTPLPIFLRSHLENYRDHVPVWSLALLSAVATTATVAGTTATTTPPNPTTATTTSSNQELTSSSQEPTAPATATNGAFLKSLKPVVGLVIFSAVSWVLIRGCENNPPPVAKPETTIEQNTQTTPSSNETTDTTDDTANASDETNTDDNNNSNTDNDIAKDNSTEETDDTQAEKTAEETNEDNKADTDTTTDENQTPKQPATLSLTLDKTGKKLYACQMTTGDQALQNQLIDTIQSLFKSPNIDCQNAVDKDTDTQMAIGEQLPDALKQLVGINSASIQINDHHIQVNSPNKEKRTQLIKKLQELLPNFEVVAEPDLDVNAVVEDSIQNAQKALENINKNSNQPNINELAKALNQQIINFDVDDTSIPQKNKKILDRAAELLSQIPNATLTIIGYTDSHGSAEYNQKLSQSRADAVKNYLISRGVNQKNIITEGRGETQPVADNETEQGRFRNRRIEFAINKEGEPTININSESTKVEAKKK